ncbi:polysaccharide biosynthesis/export family protein [Winogradskyella sp. 3972H.M.0a.05]|uniref:polysaccharide biosynthesis/export family protein n=1 Tax=Winogradskyella sp. 3972H.M.0a.05 TaxID=2950277 RepID=UPI003393494F
MKPYIFKRIAFLLLITSLASCASRKEIAYFQDEPISSMNVENLDTEITYRSDDLLTIDVSALDPDAVRPFNLPAVSYNASNIVSAQGNLRMQTYLIDVNGNIEFPVLGTLSIGGKTRTEATNYLKDLLKEYVKDPIVNIRLTNFTISVLGEVTRPGTFTVLDERISIPEALGLAGDLTIYGRRDNVFLIRDVDGKKSYAKIDLTSINMVNSPVYYLKQNDVIYVEPNKTKVRQSNFNPNNAQIISAVGIVATIVAILIR